MINIGAIKNISRVKKCSRGTIITGDGIGNILFVILKGEIGVYTNYRLPSAEMVSTLGSGDLFADPGLLQDKRAVYTTVALDEAIIVPVEKRAFSEFLQDEPSLVFELMKDLYLRLEHVSTAYKELIVHRAADQHLRDKNPESRKPDEIQHNEIKPKPLKIENAPAAAAVKVSVPSGSAAEFKLFPEEHGTYELHLDNADTTHLMGRTHTCPICKGSFDALAVKPSKLVLASTDKDMRSRYKDIEPMYYEVVTCPHCLFSALSDVFDKPDKSKSEIKCELDAIKNTVIVNQGADKDANSVFAGFYLALFCAPLSFSKYQLVAGKLLYKLSRIYQDAGDKNMENKTAQKALENYLYAYEKTGITPAQEQQICILIGELYLKQGELKDAISFFSKAKASKNSSPVLKTHAESRIYDIREIAAGNR